MSEEYLRCNEPDERAPRKMASLTLYLLQVLLLLVVSAAAWNLDSNYLSFYGGSMSFTPKGQNSDGTYKLELRNKQSTYMCNTLHSNYFCGIGSCGSITNISIQHNNDVKMSSYGINWCTADIPKSGHSFTWSGPLGDEQDEQMENDGPCGSGIPSCPRSFKIPTFDHDGDNVRCRVPTMSNGYECGICRLPQVDSYSRHSCLDGDYFPIFLAPTPSNGVNLTAFVNQPLEIKVKSRAQYSTIHNLIVTGPMGISKDNISAEEYIIKWTPTENELNDHFPICFVSEAIDEWGRVFQSELRCVIVDVGHYETKVTCNETTMTVEVEKSYLIRRNENNLHLKALGDSSCNLATHSNATTWWRSCR
ncbi:hypothetical protein F7725_025926 [Dissostichus mawsoni]|uniref:Uncharacterized protein n=1 Tax=Dissostichus mawsoni TaxID=36200 RepID=A0A7J5X5L7_DISMA|nr:hypothetical protein F7725_025926 [Dissostichus mawsoni]